MQKIFLSLFFLSCAVPCFAGQEPKAAGNGSFVIKNGISFRECVGYCYTEITIDDSKVSYVSSGRPQDSRHPPISKERRLTKEEQRSLREMLDPYVLSTLKDTYGCPDCYDQGAEWLEVQTSDFHKKIEFDYRFVLMPVEELLTFLRNIRESFET